MTHYQGYNGNVSIDGDVLLIHRDGKLAQAAFGRNATARRIPLGAITDMAFKPASRMVNGHLALGVQGAPPASKGVPSDVNAIVFTHKHRAGFDQLHAWLLTVLEYNRASGVNPAGFVVSGGGASIKDRH